MKSKHFYGLSPFHLDIDCIYIFLNFMNEDEAKLEEKKEETAYLVSPEE